MDLNIRVLTYIAEEVRRQGHDLAVDEDGGVRVRGMYEAWQHAQLASSRSEDPPSVDDVLKIAGLIECRNKGFRKVAVMIARHVKPAVRLRERVETLLANWNTLEPLEIYREFEEIHPFEDGNGRTGKVLLNWRNGTLNAPIFPPRDFWGREIQNP